ncbi:MAG: tRNA (adenosine(37)-N6)-threonylcarbamoyltransferase complex ATPase subunit type 1 TsaE [Planctomycetaceae bacterium]|nr:tRNA (adenosine(37)-N6)-threonylcarbamoyltransferase complex ATPase subunit type 1 TsaE [Planctomycetaceae bacterium]
MSSSNSVIQEITCLDDLDCFATRLAEHLPWSALVTLEGELGAGKTTFVKLVAKAVGIDPSTVTSPTFNLITIHESPDTMLRLVHADMYRMIDPSELIETGWDSAMAAPRGHRCWAFVEWPQRVAPALPAERLRISFEVTGESSRRLHLEYCGTEYQSVKTHMIHSLKPPHL